MKQKLAVLSRGVREETSCPQGMANLEQIPEGRRSIFYLVARCRILWGGPASKPRVEGLV